MTDRELFQMALNALEEYCKYGVLLAPIERREVLRARLAQPEPVIYARKEGDLIVADLPQVPTGGGGISKDEQPEPEPYPNDFIDALKYHTAINEQPEPEPVATQYKYIDAHGKDYWTSEPWEGKKVEAVRYLYTAPPQREWVGLTDAEIKDILDCGRGGLVDIKKAEAKLKEKNNG